MIKSHRKTPHYFHSILWDYSIVFLGQQRTTGKRPGAKALKDKYIITSPFFSFFSVKNVKMNKCFYCGSIRTTFSNGLGNPRSFLGRNFIHILHKYLKDCLSFYRCRTQLWSLFTTSKTDCQLLRQKVRQRISVMKTNTDVFVAFKTKHESKCQFSGITEIL